MDISGLRDELVKDSGMLENIGKALDRDGKIYGIPARVGLPIMAAKDDSGKALESLESLTSYLNENPDARFWEIRYTPLLRSHCFLSCIRTS